MHKEKSLAEIIKNDIEQFIESNNELLFNERDFQVRLSMYLFQRGYYDDVDLEYHLPIGYKKAFDKDYAIWETEKPSIDIVVRKGDEYVPIELKYKLKAISGSISRFGEKTKKDVPIVTNQSAQNLGRYAFWKDVKRIELVKKHYSNVKTGLAVFLTNDDSYTKAKEDTNYYAFRMVNGDKIGGLLQWKEGKKDDDKHYPSFTLEHYYSIKWNKKGYEHKMELMPDAYYTIVQV